MAFEPQKGTITLYAKYVLVDSINTENADIKGANSQFDLNVEKMIWQGSIEDDFSDALIMIITKPTSLYPELELKHFELEEGIIEYMTGPKPVAHLFEEGNEELLANFKQLIFLRVEPNGKEKIVELIRYLEKIDFVLSASPDHVIQIA